MKNETRHYFLASESGKGYINYFESELQHLNYAYVLKSVPGNGKSTLLKNIATHFEETGYSVDVIHNSFNPKSLDGIILKKFDIGILDGTAPHIIEPKVPFVNGELINITEACDSNKIQKDKENIISLQQMRDDALDQYNSSIAEALKLHDELEKYFTGSINIDSANNLANNIIQNIFEENRKNKETVTKHRFFDSITEKGNVDFVEDLTKNISTRYFIKGRPGSGKSTLMKKLVEASIKRGFDVELYHDDFDPDSLDIVIIPELSVSAFDSTEPHNYEPSREGDKIIDTYALTIATDTDDKYKEEIKSATKTYEDGLIKVATHYKQAKEAYEKLAKIYSQAIDFDQVKEIEKKLLDKMSATLTKLN